MSIRIQIGLFSFYVKLKCVTAILLQSLLHAPLFYFLSDFLVVARLWRNLCIEGELLNLLFKLNSALHKLL